MSLPVVLHKFRVPHAHYWDLLFVMTERELKARYKRMLFGFLWLVLNPLLQMLVIGVIFRFVTHQTDSIYFVRLFLALLFWNFFSLSVTKSTSIIVFERPLVQKARFSTEILPLAIVFSNLFHLVLSIVLSIVALFILRVPMVLNPLTLCASIVWVTALCIGVSLFTSAVNVVFRDMNFFVQAALPLLFYLTPIIYRTSVLPSSLQQLVFLNPLSGVMNLYLGSLLPTEAESISYALPLGITVFCVVLGSLCFIKLKKNFDDWL